MSENRLSTHILNVRDIVIVRGGAQLLTVPSFQIGAGEVIALIGPNGAGKTTFLLTLACLLKPKKGEVFYQGRKIGSDIPVLQYRKKIAMVFQEPLLFNTTVYKNVASGLKLRRISRREIKSIVAEQLERFQITHLADRSARTLSAGEAQRTSLARAFAINPEILLLDEPFAALDPWVKDSLIEDVRSVTREKRVTTIFATHNREEAHTLSDRILLVVDGKLYPADQLKIDDEIALLNNNNKL